MVRLAFLGSPLLDISVKCDETVLKRFQLKRDDAVKASMLHDTLFTELLHDSNSEISSGGSAQNSARVAKWILNDDDEVSFIGCTGNDTFEKWLKDKLISDGVKPLYVHNTNMKTGVCACLLIGEKDRSMIARHEAAATFSTKHLTIKSIKKHLRRADVIFVEGYFIAHSPNVVLKIAKECTPKQIFSLSLSAEYICKYHTDVLMNVLSRVNVLFGNEAELKALATSLGAPPTTKVEDALLYFRQLPFLKDSSRITIITRGSKPVLVDDGTDDLKTFKVPENISMIDSVGCGDAFAGACLATYAITENLTISVETGIRAATEIAQVKGCSLPPYKIFEAKNLRENHLENNMNIVKLA